MRTLMLDIQDMLRFSLRYALQHNDGYCRPTFKYLIQTYGHMLTIDQRQQCIREIWSMLNDNLYGSIIAGEEWKSIVVQISTLPNN